MEFFVTVLGVIFLVDKIGYGFTWYEQTILILGSFLAWIFKYVKSTYENIVMEHLAVKGEQEREKKVESIDPTTALLESFPDEPDN